MRRAWELTEIALVVEDGDGENLLRSHWSLRMGMERKSGMHGASSWLRSSGSGKQTAFGLKSHSHRDSSSDQTNKSIR